MKAHLIMLMLAFPIILFSQTNEEIKVIKYDIEVLKQQLVLLDGNQQTTDKMIKKQLKSKIDELEAKINLIGANLAKQSRNEAKKDPYLAFGVSLVVPGLGSFYNGYIGTGIFEFVGVAGFGTYYYASPTKTNFYILLGLHLLQAIINSQQSDYANQQRDTYNHNYYSDNGLHNVVKRYNFFNMTFNLR